VKRSLIVAFPPSIRLVLIDLVKVVHPRVRGAAARVDEDFFRAEMSRLAEPLPIKVNPLKAL
jgi:hypothetical protein